jgi:hypothetical protein
MMNLFKRDTEEAMVKLIATQSDLIETYRESTKDRDEIINHLKRLVNLQEQQIDDLKVKLYQLRLNQ